MNFSFLFTFLIKLRSQLLPDVRVICLACLTQESVFQMQVPSGAPPSHVRTVSNCAIHSTHSVYYSILHIFMVPDLRIMLPCKLLFPRKRQC